MWMNEHMYPGCLANEIRVCGKEIMEQKIGTQWGAKLNCYKFCALKVEQMYHMYSWKSFSFILFDTLRYGLMTL